MRALILVAGAALAVAACDDSPDVVNNNVETNMVVVCNDGENCVSQDDPNSTDNRVLNKGEDRP